jgi:aspartate/methionine/tyrosine aminotransferase
VGPPARSDWRCAPSSIPATRWIFMSPPWFFYEAMILSAGAEPVRVRVDEETFDLD